MIPFGSQRAGGQDLATHLLNAQDNERLELAQVRGAVARDLHGAFAEWEAQAHTLTRCRKYLYSLSVNPDARQGGLARAQYLDYIDRVEQGLGLMDQPRAVIFHEKNGREHCHVVWSRIDAENERAVQISYDREKLMAVTRDFARDHGLTLPDGYYRDKGAAREKNRQLSLYEKHQQDTTGLTKEERIAQVSDAWRRSDSPRAFVRALEELGYILATGKRDYVLVDRDGHMNALPKLIDDRQVRSRQVRELLAKDFPTSSLPSVDEARAMAAQRREAVAERGREQQRDNKKMQAIVRRAALKLKQESRRQAVDKQVKDLTQRQALERRELAEQQRHARAALTSAYLAQVRSVRQERALNAPSGLAAFLGRVTGMALVTKKLHAFRDRKRYVAFLEQKTRLGEKQRGEEAILSRRHELQKLDMRRKERALSLIEKRERKALEAALLKEARQREQARSKDHEPERAVEQGILGRAPDEKASPDAQPQRKIDLRKSFTEAARTDEGDSGDQGDTEAPAPQGEAKIRRRKRRKIRLEREFNNAADPDRDSSGGESGGGPRRRRRKDRDPQERDKQQRPRRSRKRDFGRDM